MTSLNPSLRLALINKAKSKRTSSKGFTLVELMVVIVVVGVLSAVAYSIPGGQRRAELGAVLARMQD